MRKSSPTASGRDAAIYPPRGAQAWQQDCRPRPDHRGRTRPSSSSRAGRPRSPPRTMSAAPRREKRRARRALGTEADPVMLEVFNNLFMSIAEQMGVTLQNTAYSVNIKERLDFSCAVFDHDGALVANAPHMPVHLGSMDRSVETIIRLNAGDIHPGDVFALNAPYNGGTHLPDITVVTPVFDDAGPRRSSSSRLARPPRRRRRHRARLDDAARRHGRRGRRAVSTISASSPAAAFARRSCTALLTDHPYPARNPHQNVADLKAQIAANEKGVAELRKMVAHFGLDVVEAYMGHVQDNAAESVRRVLERAARRRRIRVPDRHRPGHQGQDHRRPAQARGDRRLHRHLAGHGEQFQRARTGRPRRGALCLPRDGRGQDPDECRLPEADQHRHSRRLDAQARAIPPPSSPAMSRPRSTSPSPVRRHGRARQRARHDEQPHLRQPAPTSTTRRSARARRRAGSTAAAALPAPPASTPT